MPHWHCELRATGCTKAAPPPGPQERDPFAPKPAAFGASESSPPASATAGASAVTAAIAVTSPKEDSVKLTDISAMNEHCRAGLSNGVIC